MPIIKPDLSEVTSSNIPVGTHSAKITNVTLQNSKSGNPMVVPDLTITAEGKEYKRKAYHVVSGRGAYGFENLLRAAGFANVADALKRGESPEFDTDELIGVELSVVIDEELYNGEKRDRVKSYLPF